MTTPFHLNEKTILVTGASSGIGRSISIHLSAMGAKVIISGRNQDRLEQTLVSLLNNGGHQIFSKDLTQEASRDELTQSIPSIDGIVHAAGINILRPVKFINTELMQKVRSINYDVPFLLTGHLLNKKKINRGSSIVFITSIGALIGTPGSTLYSASKGGIVAGAKSMAIELAKQKVRVNCISPGIIMTPQTESVQKDVSEKSFAENEKLHPLGYGTPEDIAHATNYLISDAARWITGTNLVVDGGYTAK